MAQNRDDETFQEKTSIAVVDHAKIQAEANKHQPPCLVLVSGNPDQSGQQWLLNRPSLVLGRNPSSDIHINDGCVSKVHARFTYVDGVVSVTDLGATNTTQKNNEPLTPHKNYPLENNDLLRMGTIMFKFLKHGLVSETKEKARMQVELESARSVQASLLPQSPQASHQWVHIGGRYRPTVEIGGDWWWHWKAGDKAFAIIADATGHGAPAAMITSAARSAISTIEDSADVTLEKAYATLSKAIHKVSGGKMTMSAFMIEVDLQTRLLRFIDASHVPALLLPKDTSNLRWNSLQFLMEPVSPPLGSGSNIVHIGELSPPPGSRLVLLTDGLSERKDSRGTQIKESSFNRILVQAHTQYSSNQAGFLDSLFEQSDEWAENSANDDDLTAVTLDFD